MKYTNLRKKFNPNMVMNQKIGNDKDNTAYQKQFKLNTETNNQQGNIGNNPNQNLWMNPNRNQGQSNPNQNLHMHPDNNPQVNPVNGKQFNQPKKFNQNQRGKNQKKPNSNQVNFDPKVLFNPRKMGRKQLKYYAVQIYDNYDPMRTK